MQAVWKSLSDYLGIQKGLLWGVADTGFSHFYNEYPYAVVLAQRYVRGMGEKYDESIYHNLLMDTRYICDTIASRVLEMLVAAGAKAFIPPPSQTDETGLVAPFSFKHAAVQAGLGWIGKSSALITPQYGPRVLLRAVLTSMALPTGEPVVQGRCGDCRTCADACPWGFISGENWETGVHRETLLHYRACNEKRSGFKPDLNRKHTCGYCILACPYGQEKE